VGYDTVEEEDDDEEEYSADVKS
jgi:hypothetical protein